MNENALLDLINDLKNQIEELKGKKREEQKKEIEEMEAEHEKEMILIELKCQQEIDDYKYTISQQKDTLERLGNDNEIKNNKIGDLQTDLNNKNDEIQKISNELKTKSDNYDSLHNLFNDKVDEIKSLNIKLNKKKEKYKKFKNEESIHLIHKGNYDKEMIISNYLSEDKTDFAIKTTREGLKTYNDHFKCADYIKKEFDQKYKSHWVVVLNPFGYGDCSFTYFDKCYISFMMGEFIVSIAKVELGDESIRLVDKGKFDEVGNITNRMNSSDKDFAIKTTRDALRMYYSDHFQCVNYIQEKFQNRYDGGWGVVLQTRGYGSLCIPYYDDCSISFTMGEFFVLISKTNLRNEYVRLRNKGKYNNVDVVTNEMSCDQKNFAINTTKKSLNNCDNHFECAKNISREFEKKYGGNWCTILSVKGYGGLMLTYYDKCYICFTIGELMVIIAKTHKKNTINLIDKGCYYNVNILKNSMYNSQKDFAIETARDGLRKYNDDHFESAKYIKSKFDSRYSGSWCATLVPRGYGSSCYSYYDDCCIIFTMGEFCVYIFKSSN